MTRVLLTDGDQRATLAAARALGRAGVYALVGETFVPNLASRSRYCREAIAYPSPYGGESAFAGAVMSAATEYDVDLVLPMTDITSAILAERRDTFPGSIRIGVPDAKTFWRASDKIALHELAARLGVPTPASLHVHGSLDEHAIAGLRFPCVIKPARSRVKTPSGWIKTSVLRVASADELRHLLATRPELRHPCMVQEVIEGDGAGIFALCDRGEPRMLFAHRRLREKPPSGGVSVLRESAPLDPAITEHATRLLRALGWHGVAMVEFKRERSTGTPYLMEVNGRFWGSLQLAIDAGLNFPLEAVRLWLDEPLSAQPAYRTGVRSRWLLGDLDHLLLRLKQNGTALPGAPSLPRLLLDFCRFFRADTRYEIESLADPGPSLYEMRSYARALVHGGDHAVR